MNQVHIFVSTGRFRSFKAMRKFIDKTYTRDGDGVPSPFIKEIGLTSYEPMCIEAIFEGSPMPLATLLDKASYSDQWLPKLDGERMADSAICVFAPNRVERPSETSLEYLGSYNYKV